MASLASISTGVIHRPPRIIILGTEKIGKSTFASQSYAPIVIPVRGEEGIDGLNVNSLPPARNYADLMDSFYNLYKDEHQFGTVVIDSGSALEPLIWDQVCVEHHVASIEQVGGGFGKGYTEALSKWRAITDALDSLRTYRNMASIIIGHVKVKRFDDPEGESYDRYQFDINERVANYLYRWADCILFANTKTVVKKEELGFNKDKKRGLDINGGQRFLYTQHRPAHPGGGRDAYGQLPYEMQLDWNTFTATVSAVAQQMASAPAVAQTAV